MKKLALLCMLTAAPILGLAGTSASAGPSIDNPVIGAQQSLVEKARSDCRWVDNKWTYQRGDKMLVCRPDRPSGNGWNWHHEGNRFGWYHGGRKTWHNNSW